MSEEEIKKLIKEDFINNVMEQLDSALIFTYIQKLETQLQQKENIIKELREYLELIKHKQTGIGYYTKDIRRKMLKILEGSDKE